MVSRLATFNPFLSAFEMIYTANIGNASGTPKYMIGEIFELLIGE
jgi:hypothetical protein